MMIAAGAAWGATTLIIEGLVAACCGAREGVRLSDRRLDPGAGARRAAHGRTDDGRALRVGARLARHNTFWVVTITFAIWFVLIQRYSASRLSAFTFLTPLFGVASGHFVLGEPITATFGVAVALVLAGLVLVNRPN